MRVPDSEITSSSGKQCEMLKVKWMCINKAYEKLHRPNFYDVGGIVHLEAVLYLLFIKPEQVGNTFLMHLFVQNCHDEPVMRVAVSHCSELHVDHKNGIVFLPSYTKQYDMHNVKEMTLNYITTYEFCDLDVAAMKDKELYIALSCPKHETQSFFIDDILVNYNFKALLTDPVESDFCIESDDGHLFKVHKSLLAAHSDVFKAMFREDTAESQNKHVKFIDVSKKDLQYLIEFIYTGTVENWKDCDYFILMSLADQYDIKGLMELTQQILVHQLSISNALETLVTADMHNYSYLKKEAFKFIKQNKSVLESSVYEELDNPQLLRDLTKYIASSDQT